MMSAVQTFRHALRLRFLVTCPPEHQEDSFSGFVSSSSSSILALNSSGNSNPTRLAVLLIFSSCSIPTEGLYRSKSVYPTLASSQGSGLYVIRPLISQEEQNIVPLCDPSFGICGCLPEYGAEVSVEGLVAGDGERRVGCWLGLAVRSVCKDILGALIRGGGLDTRPMLLPLARSSASVSNPRCCPKTIRVKSFGGRGICTQIGFGGLLISPPQHHRE